MFLRHPALHISPKRSRQRPRRTRCLVGPLSRAVSLVLLLMWPSGLDVPSAQLSSLALEYLLVGYSALFMFASSLSRFFSSSVSVGRCVCLSASGLRTRKELWQTNDRDRAVSVINLHSSVVDDDVMCGVRPWLPSLSAHVFVCMVVCMVGADKRL